MTQITMVSLDEKTMASDLDRAGYKKMGIMVRSATSYEDLIKILKADGADIIVMNMDHRSLDVVDAVKKVKKYKEWAQIPVVLTSVQSSQKVRTLALKCGADLFVEQPLPRDYFIEKIKNLLDHATRGQQRVSGSIGLSFQWDGKIQSCEVGDMSPTGVLIVTDLIIPLGTEVEFQLTLGANPKSFKVSGEVVRQLKPNANQKNQPTGLGVRFTKFPGDSQQRIESWVARTGDSSNKLAYYL